MKLVTFVKAVLSVVVVTGAAFAAWHRWGRDEACNDGCDHDPVSSPSVACRLDAFAADERKQHLAETTRLVKAMRSRRELADGWEVEVEPGVLGDVARWFVDERRCCPFLSLEMSLDSGAAIASVRLRGPEGAKEILRPLLGAVRDEAKP